MRNIVPGIAFRSGIDIELHSLSQFSRPYFRDLTNTNIHNGKSFLAPPRLFKADRSLYFPNFYGRTLSKTDTKRCATTPVLRGKISVVSFFGTKWGEDQANSFTSKSANPALHESLAKGKGAVQMVRINNEENFLKAKLLWLFRGSVRKQLDEKEWGTYFMVELSVSDLIRECTGLLNSKVGYTYLVDEQCRIRWAGSADSNAEERESLAKGLDRLVEERLRPGRTRPAVSKTAKTVLA